MLPISSITVSFLDWPSPDDHAAVLFIAGCGHGCPGCQSPDLQDPGNGRPYDVDEGLARFIVGYCRRNRTDKLVLSGGDPLYHAAEVQRLLGLIRSMDPSMRFCIYTGYDYEEASRLVSGYDFIKTGRYVRELSRPSGKDDRQMTLASSNQEVHDASGRCLTRDGVMRFRKRR